MKYEGIVISVTNIEQSKNFYQNLLGQEIQLDLVTYVSFTNGISIHENYAELTGVDSNSVKKQTHNMELYFEVENLDEWIKKLKEAKVEFIHEKQECPWGQNGIRVYDPDRHMIEISESMVSVVKRFLKQGYSIEETAEKSMFPIDFVKNCVE